MTTEQMDRIIAAYQAAFPGDFATDATPATWEQQEAADDEARHTVQAVQ